MRPSACENPDTMTLTYRPPCCHQCLSAHRFPDVSHHCPLTDTPMSPIAPSHAPQQPLPLQEVPTLRQLWARGQQVILSYDDECAMNRHRELWPAIPYWWGDQVKPEKLVRYLEHMKSCGRPGGCTFMHEMGAHTAVRPHACFGHAARDLEAVYGSVCACVHIRV